MDWKVPLTTLTLGPEEEAAAARVVRGGWLTSGPEVEAFEAEFAAALDSPHAIAVANATAALDIAYEVCDLAPGDVFLIPALTFVAALNMGLRRGALPCFLDITSEDDWTPSTAHLEQSLAEHPDARLVVSMPYAGFPCDMESVMRLANNAGIPVVEDSCHAPLATIDGRALGTFGRCGTFSFFGNKNMTTGEGGMLTTPDPKIASRARLIRSHGMTTLTYDRHKGHSFTYDVVTAGHNFRIDEIRAAIGREQLRKLPAATDARRRVASSIRQALQNTAPELKLPFETHRGTASHHILPALLPKGVDRPRFMAALRDLAIQSSIHYRPLHRHSHVRPLVGIPRLPRLESIEERMVTLPLGPGFTEEQIDWLARGVRKAIDSAC